MTEELDLHLLEFARSKRVVSRRDLVAETLPDLRNAKRDAHARTVEHILEVDKDSLCCLRPQECCSFLAAERADVGLEHQVEFPWGGQCS